MITFAPRYRLSGPAAQTEIDFFVTAPDIGF